MEREAKGKTLEGSYRVQSFGYEVLNVWLTTYKAHLLTGSLTSGFLEFLHELL